MKVGHDLLVLPSTAGFVVDDGLILCIRHAANGQWTFPGGCVEPDESPHAAVVREVSEETGLETQVVQLLGVGGGPEYRVRYPSGDEVCYVSTLFECRVVGGRLQPDGREALEASFVPLERLKGLDLSPIARAHLRTAVAHPRFSAASEP
jgi:ADP-ribose pyrophosphatase YjhB (NUDIX family)